MYKDCLECYKILLDPVLQDNRLNTFAFIDKQIPGFNELLKNFKPEWFKIIGYMSQKFYIIDGTVKENIFFGNNEC